MSRGKEARIILGAPVIGPVTYSAVVLMVMITTLVTPPLLKWSLSPQKPGESPAD